MQRGPRYTVHVMNAPFPLILDAYPMNRTDSTGTHMLHELVDEIRSQGGDVHIAGAKGPPLDQLAMSGVAGLVGEGHLHSEDWRAVDAVRDAVAA